MISDFDNLVLCNHYSTASSIYVLANLEGGCLSIMGNEWGDNLKNYVGIDERHILIEFSEKETARLIAAIGGEDDPQGGLMRYFGGIDCEEKIIKFCDKNLIEYVL